MTTKRTLAELTAAFSAKTTDGGGNADWKRFFPFWKGAVDTVSTVRFLPDADATNPMGFLVENHAHELTINGKREKIACLKMYGETCPICELSARYYDKKSAEFNEELGKLFYRKKSYIGQVLVVTSPVEHDAEQLVKLVEFGPQIYKQITAAFQSNDLDNPPYELKGGHDFRFRKTVTGSGQNSYTTSNFAPKSSNVGDDVIDKIDLYQLSDYRTPKVERQAVELMLIAAQTGSSYSAPGAQSAASAPAAASTAAAPAAQSAAAPAVPTEAKMSIVETLRLRAAAAKAAAAENA